MGLIKIKQFEEGVGLPKFKDLKQFQKAVVSVEAMDG